MMGTVTVCRKDGVEISGPSSDEMAFWETKSVGEDFRESGGFRQGPAK